MEKVLFNKKTYSYKNLDVPTGKWIDAKMFAPPDFHLCYLKMKDGSIKMGWANRLKFFGLRISPDDEVLYWKKEKKSF